MKSGRVSTFKFTVFITALAALLLTGELRLLASAENQVDSALAAAKAWTAQIDAGQYDDSYAFGCEAMHEKVTQDQWGKVLKALRAPWGAEVTRKQVSHVYKGDGYQGTEGEFMIITYDTNFARLNSVLEVVVLKWEDGKWLGAGYNAKVQQSPEEQAAQPAAPNSTTEIHTDEHYKPPIQSPASQ